ncbi:flagellar export chaperone FliS [Pelomonas sp. SE-A7]|uniref:flagellar export chaperone FliS n=1 Tax=Pelomonas sp. SE-A7 TaxID=3054953 RepID=UPI00259CB2B5|nr:flagellar export chaperone FliS [Pelomonas sp. SE-A7]MDM4764504.1 flagellar export chaperone FliS [Pelomonas sp. SE-A7]
MYGQASPFAPRNLRASHLYNKIGVETDVLNASPHRLVSLLFDGLFDAMNQALGAIQHGNVELKGRSLTRAVRILDEGLKAGLNLEAGPLAADLRDLYVYTCARLTHANLHSDPRAVQECVQLLQPIREAWAGIAPRVDSATVRAA